MHIYTLQREQSIPLTRKQVFEFFADAGNLERITPPWLGFQILTPRPIEMRAGTRIQYTLRWHGVPLRWITEITAWNPPHDFVDTQRRGPDQFWEHSHRFEDDAGGTKMIDLVRYELPLGIIGRLAHSLRVRRDLETIFDFRAARVTTLLGGERWSG